LSTKPWLSPAQNLRRSPPTERQQRTRRKNEATGPRGAGRVPFALGFYLQTKRARESLMTVTASKHKLVNQLFALHKGPRERDAQGRQFLEQFLYAICREGVTRDSADQAFASLRERFFDWNELRVSSARE